MQKRASERWFRRALCVCAAWLVAAMVLAGCGGFPMSVTIVGNNTTIELKDAEDGHYGETGVISVGKNRVVVIDSSLNKGEIRIDFAEATIYSHTDEPDDVIVGSVVTSVTVGPGYKEEMELERGDYVMQITTIGNTDGTVKVNVEKK